MAQCEVCRNETARVVIGGQNIGALCQIALARLVQTPADPIVIPGSYFQVTPNKGV